MLNAEGFVAECTADNLFIVKNGALFTPPLSAGALVRHHPGRGDGTGRGAGLKVSEPNLTRYDLFNADECFLTGTGAEIMPVVKIDGRVIGTASRAGDAQAGGPIPRLEPSVRRADIQ
jgi:branched-chain amino acid aminotransferase